jgi:hypothetical protein
MKTISILSIVLVASWGGLSCSKASDEQTDGGQTANVGECGDGQPCSKASDIQKDIGRNGKVSECGGFTEEAISAIRAPLVRATSGDSGIDSDSGASPYCRDESLSWQYDSKEKVVRLLDRNVMLNCCGQHSIKVLFDQDRDVYEIAERDDAEVRNGQSTRCGCMCFFDYAVEIPGVDKEQISLGITVEVSDLESPKRAVWEGDLDLSAGAGQTLIKKSAEMCSQKSN